MSLLESKAAVLRLAIQAEEEASQRLDRAIADPSLADYDQAHAGLIEAMNVRSRAEQDLLDVARRTERPISQTA